MVDIRKALKTAFSYDYWGRDLQVKDDDAPLLFSKLAIYVFSFIFSVLFGAFMMILNIREMKRPDGIVPIASFSLGYIALVILLYAQLESMIGNSLSGFNGFASLGGLLLIHLLWDKYIGNETKYRRRKILIPSIIGIVLLGFVIAFIVLSTDIPKYSYVDIYEIKSDAKVKVIGGNYLHYDKVINENDVMIISQIIDGIGYFSETIGNEAYIAVDGKTFAIHMFMDLKFIDDVELKNQLLQTIQTMNSMYDGFRTFRFVLVSLDDSSNIVRKNIE